ncbi:MAG: Fpg/Nei family DNA glycosylase [Labilithrix sp.]|nr:Fpg/Nei family DNA glycosylase [Labilithrix sp.]
MPEGDSLHRLAAKLAPVLEGREVIAFSARRLSDAAARSLVGRRVVSVTAKGKNLLVRVDDGRVLHVHLKMEGRVFVERPRSAFWAPPRGEPDMRLAVAGAAIVGRRLPVLRILSASAERRAPDLAGLGPDLVAEGWDEPEAIARLRALPDREIAEALLVQRAVAGIGNVYKSEVCFLEGVDPRARLSELDDGELSALLRRASALLRANLGDGPRVTRRSLGGARLWVYGRGGRACLRCRTPIVRFLQGAAPGRSTYACPTCQPARSRRAGARP